MANREALPDAGAAVDVELLERLASSIRPSWELEEGPFTVGNRSLTAAEWAAIQGPASSKGQPSPVADTAGETLELDARDILPSAHPVEVAPTNGAAKAAPAVAKSREPAAESPRVAVAREAPRVSAPSLDDDELPAIRSSRKGLWIVLGGIVVLGAAGYAIHAASSGEEAAPAPSTSAVAAPPETSTAAAKATDIPPPPEPTAPATTQASSSARTEAVLAAPTQTAAAPVEKPAPAVTHEAAPKPAPQPHATHAPSPKHPPAPHPAPSHPSKPSGGGIVRDVPF